MRLPIRARLTAWYAGLLAAIIAALGAFVVLELRADLQATVDREARQNWIRIARSYATEGSEDFLDASRKLLPSGRAVAQVTTPRGRVLITYGSVVGARPIVPAGVRADALARSPRALTVVISPGGPRFRAFAAPVQRLGQTHLLVVAESLEEVEDVVGRVLVLLLLGGPAALAATALGGWWLARKALAPVDRMTAEAAEIGMDRLSDRIAVPRAADEIGQLAVTLNAMLDRLERGVKEKHQLIADASHELRTPLAVMRAEIDVSLMADDLPPAAHEVLESTRDEVDTMTRTVNNLLTLAQVDEGRLALLTTRVRLDEAIEAAANPLRPLAAAKRVTLKVDGEPCETRADPQRLHQALTNYIDNAIKFTQSGTLVQVTAWADGDEVGVTVKDNGPGIPAADRPHVFDRFYRVDRARGRAVGGSGLGLAICREVAAAHGGRAWVESEEGAGSSFSLALPCA